MATDFYSYEALDLKSASIRLVRILPELSPNGLIQCAISHETIEASYTCLSYRWGAPDPSGIIMINAKLYRVRQNLLDFLHMARRNAGAAKVFWIDALCIDQTQVSERNHQVAQMGEIYSHATCVYVWLGTNSDLQHTFPILKDPESATPSEWGIISAKQKLLEEYICDNPYWERAWIVQEIFLARTVLVWLDSQCVSFEYLHWSIDYFYLSWKKSPIARFKLSAKDSLDSRKFISKFEQAKSLYHGVRLPVLLANFQKMKCEVPRDRVFSLLSMSTDARGYSIDYSISDLDTCFGVLEQCGDLPCLCAPKLVADSIGTFGGLESFGVQCCVLELDVPEVEIASFSEPHAQPSPTTLFRHDGRDYYGSQPCQTLRKVMRYIGHWQDSHKNSFPSTYSRGREHADTTGNGQSRKRKRSDFEVGNELVIPPHHSLSPLAIASHNPAQTMNRASADVSKLDQYPAFDYPILPYPVNYPKLPYPVDYLRSPYPVNYPILPYPGIHDRRKRRFFDMAIPYHEEPTPVQPLHKQSNDDNPKVLAAMPPLEETTTESISEEVFPAIDSMGYDERERCWYADDFHVRITGSNTLVVEILLSSLHKLTQISPPACASLQLGVNITERAVKPPQIRVQKSMWTNMKNVSG